MQQMQPQKLKEIQPLLQTSSTSCRVASIGSEEKRILIWTVIRLGFNTVLLQGLLIVHNEFLHAQEFIWRSRDQMESHHK